ncbi:MULTISPECIES: ABC transporter substrate-binding protein [Arthrobacter]|uniref:Extracellular solute-binding protein n=1 Tax=Arthrobacter oryzae TaxID=409290 RepID=A0A3N0BPX8_9MICC|nr:MULTISPECIES: extracellular solute-binding protein [Arthrobacter]QYF89030.1 extracellular solute-binding protein [Arthrobacter sp. PAMC25284]RNL50492.1 extracellular solute-binding protein [Arthrobacter oryzae]
MTVPEDALRTASTRSGLNRRTLLKTIGVGAVAMAGIPALAACTGGGGGAAGGSQAVTFGSGSSDAVPQAAYKAVTDAFTKKAGVEVRTNVVPHNDFQNKINTYLQGSPDDTFTWFSGYRMQYYADKGLLAPIDDVWEKVGGNYSEAMKKASTGLDGKMYFIPNYNYPWGFFYRKSLWAEKGYEVPTTFDELLTLSKKMQGDGLIPIEFADKDGWPAMGTFDYINMRLNGYQFHMDLTAHKESWDQKKVSDVFDTWKAMLPYQNPNALGMTWQDSAKNIGDKKSGMYLLGSFLTQQYTDQAIADDIDFFPFPEIAMEGRDAVEAPIDGLLLTKKGGENQSARDFMAYVGTPEGQDVYQSVDTANIAAAKGADTSSYSPLTKKMADVIANAKSISQFFDRDALPAMANNVMIPALQTFIKDGTVDVKNLEAQAASLYAAQ